MNTAIFILFAVTAFLAGFALGITHGGGKNGSAATRTAFLPDFATLPEEYRNFLQYDGTPQK